MDRGAWQATVHRVTKSQTWLKQLSTHARTVAWWGEKSDGSELKRPQEAGKQKQWGGREGISWRRRCKGTRGFQDERTLAGWHEGLVKEKQIQREGRNEAARFQRRGRGLFLLWWWKAGVTLWGIREVRKRAVQGAQIPLPLYPWWSGQVCLLTVKGTGRVKEVSGKGPRGKLERAKGFLAAARTQMGLEIIIL